MVHLLRHTCGSSSAARRFLILVAIAAAVPIATVPFNALSAVEWRSLINPRPFNVWHP